VTDAATTRMMEPPIGPDSAPFWEATRSGRLLLQWCISCEKPVFYPRAFCPQCGGDSSGLEWREASGRGVIHAVTVEHRPEATGAAFSGGQPYAVALIELEEGVRMLSNVIGCPPEQATIGTAVSVTWEPLSDGRQLPQFRPQSPAAT